MRKILSLLLCLVIACLALTSCVDEIIGEDLPGYLEENPNTERSLYELDFYIVTGAETTDSAITTVTREINTYLEEKYKTKLNIHFVKPSENYEDKVNGAVNVSGKDRADIVLVAGIDMFESLYEADKLVALNTYYFSKEFGRLKSADMMCPALLEASSVVESDGEVDTSMYYVVPNNRVVGSYDYIMVNKEMAKFLNFACEGTGEGNKVLQMTSTDSEAYLELIAARDTYQNELRTAGFNPDELVILLDNQSYLDRLSYVEDGYICVEAATPVVSAEEAHESSFAIIAQDGNADANAEHYQRCMEVIYCINTDATLRNLLQYGVRNTHYAADVDGIVTSIDAENPYEMNLLYTGNIFMAYYNDFEGENAWTEQMALAATEHQNKVAVSAKSLEDESAE